VLVLCLLLAGLQQMAGAGVIKAKAWLAPILIDFAWRQSLDRFGAPVKPWPWADTWPVARLQVPGLDVDLYVLAGASGRSLAFGPAAVDGTEGLDHSIFSGHRDTHFAFLRHLEEGSGLRLQDPSGDWRDYVVRGHQVINVRQPVKARRAAEGSKLVTLVTCYPFDAVTPGGPLRYAVTAEITEPRGEAALSTATNGETEQGEGIPDGAL